MWTEIRKKPVRELSIQSLSSDMKICHYSVSLHNSRNTKFELAGTFFSSKESFTTLCPKPPQFGQG